MKTFVCSETDLINSMLDFTSVQVLGQQYIVSSPKRSVAGNRIYRGHNTVGLKSGLELTASTVKHGMNDQD